MGKINKPEEAVQETAPAEPMQEMMEKMLQMQADMEARFKQLEEREAALLDREKAIAEEYETVPREMDIVESKAWEDIREVFLPYAMGDDEQWVLVAVNGRKYQVPRGVPVKVPLPLYERLMIMQEQQAQVMRYRDSLPKEFAPGQALRIG